MTLRVLFLTTEFPWPATSGGSVRTVSQLEMLASLPEVDRVTLLSVSERRVTKADRTALGALVPKLDVRPPAFHPVHLWRYSSYVPRVLALRLAGVPYLAAKWDSSIVRDALRRELRDSAVDVAYVDHLGMARYLPEIRAAQPFARTVLDQHNVESAFYRQLAESSSGVRQRIARIEWKAAARFEKHVLESVDAVVAISQADAGQFARDTHARVHVVPVVMAPERRARRHSGRPHFCYVGNLGWRPNIAGLDWFRREVWPKIRARVPDATLEIAGVGLQQHSGIGAPWSAPGIDVVGFLGNLEPLYDRSLGMIAPVLGGSGVRIKILEGLRAGLPVVTTPDGAAGLPLTDAKEVLVASDPGEFAERVAWLVRDEALRARLRDAGYDYLEEHHSAAVAQRALRAALGIDSEPPGA